MSVLILFTVLFVGSNMSAQDYSYHRFKEHTSEYSKTVKTLLDEAAVDLDINIVCDAKTEPYWEMTVSVAPWKLSDDPVRRLAFILGPVNLSFEKLEDGSWRVFEPWYYIRPESEGKAHLQRLLKQFPDQTTWEARKQKLQEAVTARMGLDRLNRTFPIQAIVSDKRIHDGYTVQSVALEILPGYYQCGSLYLPAGDCAPSAADAKLPIVLCPHGHGKEGRFGEDQQLRAGTLARMGAMCFTYSMFAWIEQESPLKTTDHRDSISGIIQTLQTIRAIDWLTSLPNADGSRIGITGASGGGTQTFLGTAMDPRITVSVPVVMVSSHFYGGCPCESGIPFHIDCGGTCNAEIAAMAAPRPMLVVAVTQDWTKNVPEVEFPYLKKIYSYYGAEDKVEFAIFDEPHNYGLSKRQAMYPFMAKYLGLNVATIDEAKVQVEEKPVMYVFGPNCENYPENGIKTIDDLKAVMYTSTQPEK